MTTVTITQTQIPEIATVEITGNLIGGIDIRSMNSAQIATISVAANSVYVPSFHEQSYNGSDLNGTEPDTNRVLTLPNTRLSSGVSVFMDTGFMHPGLGITVNNLSASSTITFLTEVWDSQSIRVSWYE